MNEPWLAQYDEGVPHSIGSYPDKTLVDVVREHARERGDAIALVFKGREVSYRELDEASDALAQSLDIKPGDRVALLLPNCPQFVIAELAVWKRGGIVAPLSPLYTERELELAMAASKPDVAVVLTLWYDRVKHVQPQTSLRRIIATSIKDYLPKLLAVAFTLFKEKKEGHRIALAKEDRWLKEALSTPASSSFPSPPPDTPAVILMSGGTTGTPKGVVSDHRSLIMAGTQIAAWLHEAISGAGSKVMLPLPLFHTYGCAGAQSLALLAGIPLILIPSPREIDDLVKTIARERPTLFCGVPAMFMALLDHRDVVSGKVDFRSIRACFSGAAALMAETKKRFEELTGGRIVEGYSLTEATMATCLNPYRGVNKIGSVGLPLPDVHVRIVDDESGTRVLAAGEVGEITIRAPELMRGYWNNPEETALMLRLGDDGATWLFTGDLGYLDSDGFLFIVDRKKDLIKTSGFQVWPREIEEVLAAHPAVADVGVAGVPDERKGEVITAWVVLRSEVSTDELRAYCKEKLAPYKVPARIEIRKELPKTMIGKVLRRALVAEAKAAATAAK
jgi:long-chain acyl-CoA synthetase